MIGLLYLDSLQKGCMASGKEYSPYLLHCYRPWLPGEIKAYPPGAYGELRVKRGIIRSTLGPNPNHQRQDARGEIGGRYGLG
jgi:hypothetical protein